jgi:hypothetical protein
MRREWIAVIEIEGQEQARSTPRSLAECHRWLEAKKKYFGPLFRGKPWATYMETPSAMFKPENKKP